MSPALGMVGGSIGKILWILLKKSSDIVQHTPPEGEGHRQGQFESIDTLWKLQRVLLMENQLSSLKIIPVRKILKSLSLPTCIAKMRILVHANTRLIFKYLNKSNLEDKIPSDISDDIVQEGRDGLCQAVSTFDKKRSFCNLRFPMD